MPLIVHLDDEEGLLRVTASELKSEGYDVISFPSKKTFLACVQLFNPDLIISDINSPEMNGLDFLRAIKSDERHRHIPVIMASGMDDPPTIKESLRLGAADYIPKPFQMSTFLEAVRRVLPLRPGKG